jgi:hypothetical protein
MATEALLGLPRLSDSASASKDPVVAKQVPTGKGRTIPAPPSKGKGKAKAVSPVNDPPTDDELLKESEDTLDIFQPGFETQQFIKPFGRTRRAAK